MATIYAIEERYQTSHNGQQTRLCGSSFYATQGLAQAEKTRLDVDARAAHNLKQARERERWQQLRDDHEALRGAGRRSEPFDRPEPHERQYESPYVIVEYPLIEG